MHYNVAIIGGGPAGYTAARKASEEGLSVVLFEDDQIGGTCLNRGCIPTKTLLHSSEIYRQLANVASLGISAQSVSYDYSAVLNRKNEVVTQLREGIEKMLKGKKVTVVRSRATVNGKCEIVAGQEVYTADDIIICTGSVPSLIPIKGIENAVTSNEILESDMPLAEELIIIGGGVIGVEIASLYLGFGHKVTILEMADQLLPTIDSQLASRIQVYLKKRGAEVILKAAVREITQDKSVIYQDKNGVEKSVKGDLVLCAAGRKANIAGLFDGLDININRGIVTDENYRTSVEHIYAIGDCRNGSIQLAHNASAQAVNVIDVIKGRDKEVDDTLIPSCIYTEPQIATVGLNQQEAKAKGLNVSVRKSLTGANGKALIEQAESGYVSLVINNDNNQIIGAQLICPDATNLIGELALAVQKKLTVEELKQVVHPHPTLVEMIYECL